MKIYIFFTILFTMAFPIIGVMSQQMFQLQTAGFSIYVRNGDNGFQYKAGLDTELHNSPEWYSPTFGSAENKKMNSRDFTVTEIDEIRKNELHEVRYTLQHRLLPLQVFGKFTAYVQTGTIGHNVEIRNTGVLPIRIEEMPSVDLPLVGQRYECSYLTVKWSNERRLVTIQLDDTLFFESKAGRSSAKYSPWISLQNLDTKSVYIAQLAWSGNWKAFVSKQSHVSTVSMSEYFDNGFLTLMPGKTHNLPSVIMSGGTSLDNAANHIHNYQRDFLIPKQPIGWFMPVQFNSWFPFMHNITAENLKPYIDKAAELGCEVFTIDAGWFTKKDWGREVGDWQTNIEKFPDGIGATADYIRSRGMKFGLWFEIESVGALSDLLAQHPDWCLQYDGRPKMSDNRMRGHLDFSNTEVFDWAFLQFDRLYRECHGIDWVKLDYNVSIGSNFENEMGIKTGDCLHRHITSYYRWLDTLRSRYPDLLVENCSSGGLCLDSGIAAHTHTTFISDETSPNPSLGMAWSATLEYLPRALNHWTVGMNNHEAVIDQSLPYGYWDYMFKVQMNGQFGISSKILEWSPELWQCALKNINLYKRIRTVIADADCYHLTPQPDFHDPCGWAAMQFVSPTRQQSVLMVYRTRTIEPVYQVILQGLLPKRKYRVRIDDEFQGVYNGDKLMKSGLKIRLPDEFRACIVEFN